MVLKQPCVKVIRFLNPLKSAGPQVIRGKRTGKAKLFQKAGFSRRDQGPRVGLLALWWNG